MANVLIEETTMTSIGDSIRSKTGKTDLIFPANMPEEIDGITTGIDTSDADAIASDIVKDKTAYVNGEKIVGTLYVPGPDSIYVKSSGTIVVEEDTDSFTFDTDLDDVDGVIVCADYISDVDNTYAWVKDGASDGVFSIAYSTYGSTKSFYKNSARTLVAECSVTCKQHSSIRPIIAGSYNWIAYGYITNKNLDSIIKITNTIEIKESTESFIYDTSLDTIDHISMYPNETVEKDNDTTFGWIYDNFIKLCIFNSSTATLLSNGEYVSINNGSVTFNQMNTSHPIKTGTYNIVAWGTKNTEGVDTSDADATETDILSGKTAYVNGVKLTGTHECSTSIPVLQSKSVEPSESTQTVSPDDGYDGLSSVEVTAISSTYIGSEITKKESTTYTPGTSDQTIESGQYLNGTQIIKGDANLISDNIKNGISIFGVSGNYDGSGGTSGGLVMKIGTTTSGTIETGLSSVKFIAIYKSSVSATGLIQAIYLADDNSANYTYCSSYSSYYKTYAVRTDTSSTVSGGTFTWGGSGISGLSSSTTYNWIAFGNS